MDLTFLKGVCQQLNQQEYVEKRPVIPLSTQLKNEVPEVSEQIINRQDFENLRNFVRIWTDRLEIEEVKDQFNDSDFNHLTEFEAYNHLYHLGFFYVKVDSNCSTLEFLGLLDKIPFEQFCTPGTYQVSYITLTHLFGDDAESEQLIMQLMVLGDFFKYWMLVNPYKQMLKTHESTKLLLSGMGNLYIVIAPSFIQSCIELVQNMSTQQTSLFK